MRSTVTLAALAALLGSASAQAADCKKVNSLPYTINSSGQYCLKKDLSTGIAAGAAIDVKADDVILDLGGHTVAGTAGPATDTVGIRGEDVRNVSISNGTLRGFKDGINLFFSISGGSATQLVNHSITDITVEDSTRYGIRSDGSGVVVRRNRVTGVGDPAAPFPGAEIGIELAGDRHVVENNVVADTTGYGVLALTAGSGVVRGNQLMDTAGLGAAPSGGSPSPNAIAVYENQIVNSDDRTGSEGIHTPFGGVACKDNMVANFTDLTSPATPCLGAGNVHMP